MNRCALILHQDRLLPSELDFDTPEDMPVWKPCPIPLMKAGMTRSMGAGMTKGRVLSSNAFQEVYLRSCFAAKKNGIWYDFADNGGRLICSQGPQRLLVAMNLR